MAFGRDHLFRRWAVYWWRRWLPSALSISLRRTEIVRSLRTREPALARRRPRACSVAFDRAVMRLMFAQFWSVLIGLYTGLRLGEIAQLYPTDIKRSRDFWYLDLTEDGQRSCKTEAGERQVPLHPMLVQLGLPKVAAILAPAPSMTISTVASSCTSETSLGSAMADRTRTTL